MPQLPATRPARPWLTQATFALQAAIDEDWPAAKQAVEQVAREHGVNEIPNVLLGLIDTLLIRTGITSPDALMFQAVETGAVTDADGVPPRIRWAGRLIMARARDDQAAFRALINSITSDEEWSSNCSAVLETCALGIRRHQQQEARG